MTSTRPDGTLPLVLHPPSADFDLAEWARDSRAEIDQYLNTHGAILFREFPLRGIEEFERVAAAICPDLFAEYGDLPRQPTSRRVYGSTPYPADKMIRFHNESAHLPQWPMKQFFFCDIPAECGGTTPLVDCRRVLDRLDASVVRSFEEKGLLYVRNFVEGVDVPWQEFFKTDDKRAVERLCADAAVQCIWTSSGLRTLQRSPAVATHPRTRERVFFNQAQLHHVSCLDAETRALLQELFAEEDLPRSVYYGDGSRIPDEVMTHIGEVYEVCCVEFPWKAGDLIVLDNMLVAHARRPFSGARRILVAMGEMTSAGALADVTE